MDKGLRDVVVGLLIAGAVGFAWSSWDNPRAKAALTFGWLGVVAYDAVSK